MEPFTVAIDEPTLADLRSRLDTARVPRDEGNRDWRYGTNGDYLRELIAYWRHEFDWRAQERAMNAFPHYRVTIDDVPIHFMHVTGRGSSGARRPLPLILTHGWPWTFWDFAKVIGPLTDPAAHGGDAADAFDVIVPSLPGYGFSTPLAVTGINWWRTADLWATLMTDVLGYERFGAHGGDWGAAVTLRLGHAYPERLAGVHATVAAPMTLFSGERPWSFGQPLPPELPADVRASLLAYERKIASHVAVNVLDPQTLAYAMNDSPVGLCAWLLERRRSWSDCHGDVESRFTKDELLTHATIYWATESFGTSARYYYEAAAHPAPPAHERLPVVGVPSGFTLFAPDAPVPERSYLETYYNLRFLRVRDQGGHFAPAEEADALVDDLRDMFRPLR